MTKSEKARKHVAAIAEGSKVYLGEQTPEWLEVDRDKLEIRVTQLPNREQFPYPINEQLIVEGMSK